MGHTIADKHRLLNRVRRLKGQIEAVERALEAEEGCSAILQRITAARGALNGLMAEVLEDHVHVHVRGGGPDSETAAEELIDVIRTYLR